MVKEQQTPQSPEGTTEILSGSVVSPDWRPRLMPTIASRFTKQRNLRRRKRAVRFNRRCTAAHGLCGCERLESQCPAPHGSRLTIAGQASVRWAAGRKATGCVLVSVEIPVPGPW